MPSASVVVPVLVFAAMVVLAIVAVRKVVVAGGRARRETVSVEALLELALQADGELARVIATVDTIRRHAAGPEEVVGALDLGRETLRACTETASKLAAEQASPSPAANLAAELERAQRALELTDHGLQLLEIDTFENRSEGEIAIKRGYLNLVHAREAIAALGRSVEAAGRH